MELIKRFNQYIIVDDSEIKDGDYVLRSDNIIKAYISSEVNEWLWKDVKKITHSTLPIENKNEWNNIIQIFVHNINNHFIVVDNSEISKGDFVYVDCPEIDVKDIRQVNDYYNEQYLFTNGGQIHIDYCKKITHSTQPFEIIDYLCDCGDVKEEILGFRNIEKIIFNKDLTRH